MKISSQKFTILGLLLILVIIWLVNSGFNLVPKPVVTSGLDDNVIRIQMRQSGVITTYMPGDDGFDYYNNKANQIIHSLDTRYFFNVSDFTLETMNTETTSDYMKVFFKQPVVATVPTFGEVEFTEFYVIWNYESFNNQPQSGDYAFVRFTQDLTNYQVVGFAKNQYTMNAFQQQYGRGSQVKIISGVNNK